MASKFNIGDRVSISSVLFFNDLPRAGTVVHVADCGMVYIDRDDGQCWDGFHPGWVVAA